MSCQSKCSTMRSSSFKWSLRGFLGAVNSILPPSDLIRLTGLSSELAGGGGDFPVTRSSACT